MDTKDYRLFSEAYASIYTENQIEPEGEVISEMPEMKPVRTTSSGQKRYSTKDDGRHQRDAPYHVPFPDELIHLPFSILVHFQVQ